MTRCTAGNIIIELLQRKDNVYVRNNVCRDDKLHREYRVYFMSEPPRYIGFFHFSRRPSLLGLGGLIGGAVNAEKSPRRPCILYWLVQWYVGTYPYRYQIGRYWTIILQ